MKRDDLIRLTLNEAPIGDINMLGKWDKPGSFRAPDRKLLTAPRMIERLRNAFLKTPYDFEMFFINAPGVGKHLEVGRVGDVETDPWSWFETNLPKQVKELKKLTAEGHGFKRDSVNVVFTSNQASEKFLMTPWIVAHRLTHVMRKNSKHERMGVSDGIDMHYQELHDELIRMTTDILKEYYVPGDTPTTERSLRSAPNNVQMLFLKFWEAIGSFRSARENNLRDPYEMVNELFAQYLIQGEIKFRPAPQKFSLGVAWGRPVNIIQTEPDRLDDINAELGTMGRTLDYYCQSLVGANIGNIYVM